MTYLFEDGELNDFFRSRLQLALQIASLLVEDELLARSTEDLVHDLAPHALIDPLVLHHTSVVDGDVTEVLVDVSREMLWPGDKARGFRVSASYAFEGDSDLFRFTPSHRIMRRLDATLSEDRITISFERPGAIDHTQAAAVLSELISPIATMAAHASRDAEQHNAAVAGQLRSAIEDRKQRVMERRALAGSLGFPLTRRPDAPLRRYEASLASA